VSASAIGSPSGGECVDLHAHSTASDGSCAPAAVVAAASTVGLSAIALTDHDTTAGLAEAAAAGTRLGIRVVPGVELSAVEGDLETHILGLHLAEPAVMEEQLVAVREMRLGRAERIVARLNVLGIPVQLDAVLRHAAGGAVGRPHVARAMIDGGWATDFREAFDKYLGNGKAAYVAKERLSLEAAIELIHRAGGLAVLAHPGSQGARERLAALKVIGLDGVEVLHPSHDWEDARKLDVIATELDLVRSGGSDWHGAPEGSRALGTMRVPAQWVAQQDARAAHRRARRVA
jgi:predicted metal-dependent phosphoesterase TrpH